MFFGRSSEISSLRALFSSKNAVISVVYGRRRIGKTSLVREAARGWVFYVFEGLEGESTSAQKRAFLEQLACYGLEIPSEIDARSSWQSILALLTKLVDLNESTVILLDEFQWLANYRTELVSQLKLVWDKLLSKHRTVKLVLCGSIASFLLKKVVHSKALYGRTDLVINLQGFSLSEAKQMLQGRGVDEVMLAYSLVGGVPKYLELLNERDSVINSFQFHTYREHSYFSLEYDKIFVSHFGKNPKYQLLVEALNGKRWGLSRQELAKSLKTSPSGELTRLLDDLEHSGFIHSFVPFDRSPGSKFSRYRLSDLFLNYYFAFLRQSIQARELNRLSFLEHIYSTPKFKSHMGYAFELICQLHQEQIATILGFNRIRYRVGPYYKHAQGGALKGVQFDLVYSRADKVFVVCEAKFTTTPPGLDIGKELQQRIAQTPELDKKTVQPVLISAQAPTHELQSSGYFTEFISLADLIGAVG